MGPGAAHGDRPGLEVRVSAAPALQAWIWLPVVAGALAGGLLVVLDDRRALLALLGVEYLAAAWFAALPLPFLVVIAKLCAGFLACCILGLTHARIGWRIEVAGEYAIPTGRAFRVIAVLLVVIAVYGAVTVRPLAIPQLTPMVAVGGAWILGLGLLQLGLHLDPFRVGLGLLALLAGFEGLYSALEPSLLVSALLAAIHLGLAVAVSYLMLSDAAPGEGAGRP